MMFWTDGHPDTTAWIYIITGIFRYMYWGIILNSMLFGVNFQTLLLIGWQRSCQSIRRHVRKSLITELDLTRICLIIQAADLWTVVS